MKIEALRDSLNLDARAFERGMKEATAKMHTVGLMAAAVSLIAPPVRSTWITLIKREGRQATDEEMATWLARRAQGTPSKRPGHRLARKRKD